MVGTSWYSGFMRRNKSEISSKLGVIKDINRHTWCVYETFDAMYNHVYERLVEENLAMKLDSPVMFDINGSIVTDPKLAFGQPTRYKLAHPKYFLFVDETGKNTNMKVDGSAGSRRLVVPANLARSRGSILGSTTDIHFTVLCFTCATGEPVMCAVILKSDKKISELPLT